jgi:hypothetical protein
MTNPEIRHRLRVRQAKLFEQLLDESALAADAAARLGVKHHITQKAVADANKTRAEAQGLYQTIRLS